MSTTQIRCGSSGRRQAVLGQSALNGIDYLEVDSVDQRTLRLVFLHPLPGSGHPGAVPADPTLALTADNVRIEGGVRISDMAVAQLTPADARTLLVDVDEAGDFSTYTLRLCVSATSDQAPPGFDPELASVGFSFKVGCPSDLDCRPDEACAEDAPSEPEIDYLARDFESFRRLMLDRMSVVMPAWRDRNPADVQITLVELLAHAADELSYHQDAVATEAYLGTARQRVSLRRHARLLDYTIGEGCNARAFVALTVEAVADGLELPGPAPDGAPGTALLTRQPSAEAQLAELPRRPSGAVFETMHDLTLVAAHNRIAFYTWNDSECCLPAGATRVTLRDAGGLALAVGDLLLLEEERSPLTGLEADRDPRHRHVVRLDGVRLGLTDPLTGVAIAEVSWGEEDALPFPLCLSARLNDADGNAVLAEVAVARGNVVLADHGRHVDGEELLPSVVPIDGSYRPTLPRTGLTFAAPFDPDPLLRDARTGEVEGVVPAAAALRYGPADALPVARLRVGFDAWTARRDLLSSDRFAADFVVEMAEDGVARLRFGDDVHGGRPVGGTRFELGFRVGGGAAGNLGADALHHVVVPAGGLPPGSITAVRNPLPARGGVDPETAEEVRQFAPQAFRRQERAVTEADWSEVAERFPGVQRAAARFRWTGSWTTVFVTIDRVGGASALADDRFARRMREHLERYRIAGYDLELRDPAYVPLEIELVVCVAPRHFRGEVRGALARAFGRREHADGTRGLFHPDNFSFGDPLYLSRVYSTAMAVAGVASVQVKTFQRFGEIPNNELANAVVPAAPLEILRLDNDASLPENGRITFDLHGGL